jgi:hypothetical protein
MQKTVPNKLALIAAPAVFYLFLVVNGLMGINFGYHWDEHLFVAFADDFHFHGRIIPTNYLYPSFCYFLTLAASIVFRWFHHLPADAALIQNMQFTLFTRGIFVCMASLCVIWVYILALKITKRFWAAVLAGLIFCCSFEFSYHSRWAVSDLIAVQFAFLSTLILFLDIQMPRRILISAFIAGVAAGTKYTAGIVCLNILITLLLWTLGMGKTVRTKFLIKYLICVGLVFGFAFVLTTPGCIYHLKTFISAIHGQKKIYGTGHLPCDTVIPGWPHFSQMTVYFIFYLFSKYNFASLVISAFVFIGTAHALREKKWEVFGLFVVMFIYILYVSSFRVMIVRNDLYVLPYFVVLAAYGVYSIHEHIKSSGLVRAVDALLAVVIACSLYGIITASWSIYAMSSDNMNKDVADFLKKHPGNRYYFSRQVRLGLPPGYDIARQPTNGPAFLVFFKSEVKDQDFPPNGFGRYGLVSGPQDVNLNYYPTWSGVDRIVVIKLKDANPAMLLDVNVE